MIADKKIEDLEHSSAKLTVTVDKEKAKQEYDSLIDKYRKTAQIKGFRRGKVPAAILEQKFGESLRTEAGLNIIENSLKVVFEDDEIERKPLPLEPPSLDGEVNLEIGKDFTFSVTYDVYPEITLGEYKGVAVEIPQVTVGKEDIDRRLDEIRDQNSIVVDKTTGAAEDGDIVTIDYVEVDSDGNDKPDTSREGYVFTLGSGYNPYDFDKDLEGMAPGEEKMIEKDYPEDYEDTELAGTSVRVKVKLTELKEKQLPELDDELAQDVDEEFETLDDLKNSIKEELEVTLENEIRRRKITAIVESVRDSSEIDVPESMIRAEQESSWRRYLSRIGATEDQMNLFLKNQGNSKDQMLKDWRPSAEEAVKTQLIENKIMELEDISASEEDVEKEIREFAEARNADVEETRKSLSENGVLDYLRNQIAERKLHDFLVEHADLKKGKKTTLLDLLQNNQ